MSRFTHSRVEREAQKRPERGTTSRSRPAAGAFTLIELLVVIAVAGVLAALAVPAIKEFGRSNKQIAATRQMLNDVGRARQLAIANRTTVYMVFLTNTYLPQVAGSSLTPAQERQALSLAPGQGRAYALLSLRSLGDQPGQHTPRYLTEWRTLPQGWIIAPSKFIPRSAVVRYDNANATGPAYWDVRGFQVTNGLPFPSAEGPVGEFFLPYIAFDYQGRLTSQEDEFIPLARGTVDPAIAPQTRDYLAQPAVITESPPDNSISEYNIIHIDWLTGRARLEEREIE